MRTPWKRRAQPTDDWDHDHEWYPDEDEPFILEDGVAVFLYWCEWSPVIETARSERLGSVVVRADDECGEGNHVRLGPAEAVTEDELEEIERAWHTGSDVVEVAECDPPHPENPDGRLVVVHEDTVVTYNDPQ